ncbi:MAG: YggT family protein [Deltaproteobacteria bacterium]|nr:YggT family protein [Deltaproteobacteria bacterium]
MQEFLIQSAGGIRLVIEIYSWMHIAAFLLSWVHADPNNKIVSIINRSTMPLWRWVQKKLPYKYSAFAPIVALMLIFWAIIAIPGIYFSFGATSIGFYTLNSAVLKSGLYVIAGVVSVSSQISGFIMIIAIIWFILTLVNPAYNNPIARTIYILIDPLITPLQRVLPRAKIDLAPIIVAILAYLVKYNLTILYVYLIKQNQLVLF